MPQVLTLAVVGTIAYLGYRALKRVVEEQASLKPVPVRATRLERGADGVYRPVVQR